MRRWSAKEEKQLAEAYGKIKTSILASELGRTKMAIYSKAVKCGLTKKRIRPNSISTLSQIQRAYLAGIIDGEGAIFIAKGKRSKNNKGEHRFVLVPSVSITNTDLKALKHFQDVIGSGGIYKNRARTPFSKPLYQLMIRNLKSVLNLLTQINRFSVIKTKQIDLAIKFCRSRLSHPSKRYTLNELKIYDHLKKLNRRGPTIETKE